MFAYVLEKEDKLLVASMFGDGAESELFNIFRGHEFRLCKDVMVDRINQYITYNLANNSNRLDCLSFKLITDTSLQKSAWIALKNIPRGTTITYGQLTKNIGRPTAIRAVASACAKNPLSVILPCHRVVPASGDIGGYRWGSDMKAKLLKMEQYAK